MMMTKIIHSGIEAYRKDFKTFIHEHAPQYDKLIPDEFYDVFYKFLLTEYPKSAKKDQYSFFFERILKEYVYAPLADKNEEFILFTFFDKVNKDTFQQHIWQLIGIGKASPNRMIFERNFHRILAKNVHHKGNE